MLKEVKPRIIALICSSRCLCRSTPRPRKTGTRRIERVAAASVARIALGGSGDTPVGSQERADRNADHVVDALLGRCIAGIEEERSENRGVARIQELGRCDLAVLNCQNPGGDLTLENDKA